MREQAWKDLAASAGVCIPDDALTAAGAAFLAALEGATAATFTKDRGTPTPTTW